jgi:hypothetical protein
VARRFPPIRDGVPILEREPQLEPGEVRSHAEMFADSKRDVRVRGLISNLKGSLNTSWSQFADG